MSDNPGKADAVSVNLREYLWLKWFFENADFGPATDDVVAIMKERYEEETGNDIPDWVWP